MYKLPGGAYIRRGDLPEGFLRYDFEGLIFGGAYTWRGLFSEFYGMRNFKTLWRLILLNPLKVSKPLSPLYIYAINSFHDRFVSVECVAS